MNHITSHIAVQYNGLTFSGSTPKHINQYLIEENIMKIFYKTSATATGGRDGHTQVDDDSIGFDLVSFQNESGKQGTNPEQLFAMGYAACFDSAMNHIAPTLGLKPTKSSTTVGVGIGQKPDLDITITVAGLTEDEARKLITRAHEVCPYSNATRGNVDVRLHVNVIQSFDL